MILYKLFQYKSSRKTLGGSDERRLFDEWLTATESLSRILNSIASHPILRSRFHLEFGNAVLSALRQSGIEVRFSAAESKAKTLKTLLYRGNAVEIIDLLLFIFRKSIIKVVFTLEAAKKIRGSPAYNFVY